jgi:hypothetical protein
MTNRDEGSRRSQKSESVRSERSNTSKSNRSVTNQEWSGFLICLYYKKKIL